LTKFRARLQKTRAFPRDLELVHKENGILQGLLARAANGIGTVHVPVPRYLRFRL
jgi:hypothetical protein